VRRIYGWETVASGWATMPINEILKGGVFEPKHIEAMGQAFEAVCSGLELTNRDDPLRDLVARKVIECAQRGEHDPERLARVVLSALQQLPPGRSVRT
jgi:hypothetical protein